MSTRQNVPRCVGRISAILAVVWCTMAAPAVGSAKSALKQIGIHQGVCVVLGLPKAEQASFVTDVARGSELTIYFQSPENDEITAVRKAAEAAGLLGNRVFVDRGDFHGFCDNTNIFDAIVAEFFQIEVRENIQHLKHHGSTARELIG